MVAEPAALAVTTPEEETVATEVLLEDQVTALLVALEGETVAVIVAVLPSSRLNEVLSNDTPVTEIVAGLTVTAQVAFFAPSSVVQVMVAEPTDLAVTTPEVETVATEVLLEDQVTALLVALEGETVAVRVAVLPSSRLNEVLSNDTPVTATVAALTVTVQVAFFAPSSVAQVMVAEPAALAVTTPEVETVATDVLLEDQVTPLLVALEGKTVAVRVAVLPSSRLNEVLSNDTPVTETEEGKLM